MFSKHRIHDAFLYRYSLNGYPYMVSPGVTHVSRLHTHSSATGFIRYRNDIMKFSLSRLVQFLLKTTTTNIKFFLAGKKPNFLTRSTSTISILLTQHKPFVSGSLLKDVFNQPFDKVFICI